MSHKLNRRQFLSGLLLASGGLVAGRCTPQAPPAAGDPTAGDPTAGPTAGSPGET